MSGLSNLFMARKIKLVCLWAPQLTIATFTTPETHHILRHTARLVHCKKVTRALYQIIPESDDFLAVIPPVLSERRC